MNPFAETHFTLMEFAAAAGVHWATVQKMVKSGRLAATKVHGVWLIERPYGETWLSQYEAGPGGFKPWAKVLS